VTDSTAMTHNNVPLRHGLVAVIVPRVPGEAPPPRAPSTSEGRIRAGAARSRARRSAAKR
jgi:hypothetical protein